MPHGCGHNLSADERLVHHTTRRLVGVGWLANAIGAVGVFIAIGFLAAVFFGESESRQLGRENWPVVVIAIAAGGVILTVAMKRRRREALAWLIENREPTEHEHRLTLGLPTFTAVLTASAWVTGGLVCGILNLEHGFETAALITTAIWLGGDTTAALGYLITERIMRPITARALAARQPERTYAPSVRDRLLFAWSLGTAVPVMSVLAVGIVGLTKTNVDSDAVAAACVFLGSFALAVGLLATLIVARAITDPLNAMGDAVERVREGELDVELLIDDASEVGRLQAGFNRMAEGLRERERIRDIFGRQVGHDVARAALRDGARLGGEEREIGALFVDLTGSTSMSLAMPPTEVVRLLNKFFRVVIEAIESEGGLVNKFEGDAALGVFGAPIESPDPAGAALRAARKLCQRLEREVPEIGFGIGVSAGKAVAGNVGAEQRFEYTVIGDPVNEAARLSELAKERSARLIASDAALDRASSGECEEWEVGERTVLRGRLEATGLASPRA
jgi:adenylate cyclase